MATHTGHVVSVGRPGLHDPGYQAFLLLRAAFTVVPIVFGLDKFFNLLTDWPGYLAPWVDSIVPGTAHQAMYVVGVVEIAAGVLVAVRPIDRRIRRRRLAGRHHRQPVARPGFL